MKRLNGKTAVVTGAAMGMGRCIAGMLMGEGCKVALLDVNRKALDETREAFKDLGHCEGFVCDVSDREAVYATAASVRNALGPVSVLVNNAGIVRARELLELDDAAIEKTININLTSMFWTCKAYLPDMISRNEGHVVNMASAGGILAIPNLSAYCASKFGVIGFSDALRQEMSKKKTNVGVTFVCPNTVNTGMFDGSKMVAGTTLLSAEKVAAEVIKAIKKNKAMVAVPNIPVKIMTPLSKLLMPIKIMDLMNRMLGMWKANDTWTGRNTSEKGA
ncbi:MAG: SDR family oxidoreductase [Thermodesulfobacteriota bacterium]